MARRRVYRVCVDFGGRSRPKEYTFQAKNIREAIRRGLKKARKDKLSRPHEVSSVIHMADLD